MGYKDIKGFEGEYQIDTEGNTYSCKFGKRRLLKPQKDKYGYLMVRLYKDGKGKRFYVHRLVAMAFIPNSENLQEINHINEDKTDNRVSNLEWCDHLYNMRYGTCQKRRAETQINGKCSKPVNQYTKEGLLVAQYPSASEVERQTGYGQSHISACCNGKRKSCGCFIWRYAE